MNQKPYTIYLPDELINKVERYQKDNYISTRNATLIQLITKSLREYKEEENEEEKKG